MSRLQLLIMIPLVTFNQDKNRGILPHININFEIITDITKSHTEQLFLT